MAPLSAERRQHRRHPLAGSVQCTHPPTQKQFPARCIDISKGGALVYVPVSTPVAAGQAISVQFGPVEQDDFADLADQTVACRIIRVNRQGLLEKGSIAVGIEFDSD